MTPSSKEIRQKFLDFFQNKGHKIVPSVPIVVKNDPTLMFINAGMNPFKDYFLGNAKAEYPRVADTQKCLRVSGKHNDLEEVGVDTYHHTLFEMLGNWSFGDYFKEEAIDWAWELLNTEFGIAADRMYVTVFEGDDSEGLARDEESAKFWAKHVSPDRILNGNKKDNFWEMGDTGPCGPCSEIHVDMRSDEERAKVDGASLVNADHPQVVEIWNLVFMQFNRKADGKLEPLPATHVDTGMGFERLCMVLQGKTSSYDTDVFQPIIRKIESLCGIDYGQSERTDIAMRVMADHLRTVSFAIADGQLPSNNGAGYVIRRILRRAVRYAYSVLEIKEPLIASLLPVLVEQMGEQFPELKAQHKLIAQVATEEENAFIRTLEQGLVRLEESMKQYTDTLPGEVAFELYDTFGFPYDLTALILRENSRSVDEDGFKKEMQKQKDRSRAAGKMEAGDWTIIQEGQGNFLGYDTLKIEGATVCRHRQVVDKKKSYYQLVFENTPFYPEGGGQIGDSGWIIDGDKRIAVWNTKKENGLILHFVNELPTNNLLTLEVNAEARRRTTANHSATHLLHHALREILGTHVEQKGSFVGPDYLRFDFSHFSKISGEDLQRIEDRVNELIASQDALQEFRDISMDEALERGALALFGEKYGEKVRAIRFGESMELCGGTHVNNTAFIGIFSIQGESSVAAGIRRIEAITGDAVRQAFLESRTQWLQLRQLTNSNQPIQSVEQLQSDLQKANEKLKEFERNHNRKLAEVLRGKILTHGAFSVLIEKTDLDSAAVKDFAFALKNQHPNLFLVLAGEQDGKAILSIAAGDEAVSHGHHAGNLVREWSKLIRGGGGGQAFFATAGGGYPQGIKEVLEKARAYIGLN